MIKLYKGDCLIESDKIKNGSVDLILTDLPYGNMNTDGGRKLGINGWDLAIDPKKVYEIANRVLRKNGKMILFSQEPYTTKLITEAIPNIPFNYRATWEKDNFAVALGAKVNMVSFTEDVLIFSKGDCYNAITPLRKIMFKYAEKYGKNYLINLLRKEGRYTSDLSAKVHTDYKFGTGKGKRFDFIGKTMYDYLCNFIDFQETFEELKEIDNEYKIKYGSIFNLWEGNKYKSNILKYKKDYTGHHPTQKPVLLLEDLIKTFSNENDLVVDLTMGSGSTGVACINTNRNFIGIEQDKKYFEIALERIAAAEKERDKLTLFS
jgi:DNA modification methylase